MCGIVGILAFDPRVEVDGARVRRMLDALKHRGPDGEGVLLDGPVGLGHRRLAIVDVRGGHQPMANEDGDVWIAFNGEIYNHHALRAPLETCGHRYRTRSDTETILHLYEEHGEPAVERLRGMFAFAVWDRAAGRLLLARDPLGIKPLYLAWTRDELLFASEIKALLAGGVRPALDEQVLPQFLANRFVSGPVTFFRGITQLLPGRTLSVDARGGAAHTRRYWSLPAPAKSSLSLPQAAEGVRERLHDAVRSHLMSDVPLGLFLSGGIDSTALLGHMARLMPEPVRTYSVGFREQEANELAYARMAAAAVGARHRDLVVTPEQFFEALPGLVWHEDEPIAFPSSVPLYLVSRLASEDVKVVLTGEGADELFLGYNRYRVALWNARLGGAYRRLTGPGPRRAVAGLLDRLPAHLRHRAQRTFLAQPEERETAVFESADVFTPERQRGLLADPLWTVLDPHAEALRSYRLASGETLDRLSRADIETYLVRLLMKQDRMSMAASIESRVPYLDQALVEYAATLPERFKLSFWQTKRVLREAVRETVPAAVLRRRKMGFPVPIGSWLRGRFWPLAEELLLGPRTLERGLFDPRAVRRLAEEHRSGVADHGERLWLLANLEIWQRVFLENDRTLSLGRAA
jgi:asparagine synthase (glutamine-hydrolysing)